VPVVHGEPPSVRYGIASAAMEKIEELQCMQREGKEVVLAFYDGGAAAAAITLGDYNGLPLGSIIFDRQAFKVHQLAAAATWKSSAAMS